MSEAVTDRVASLSPVANPSEAEKFAPMPLTLASETVMRRLSASPVIVTSISLPVALAVTEHETAFASMHAAVPVDAIARSNWNTTRWPLPMARGSTLTVPPMGWEAMSMSKVPAPPCVLRDFTAVSAGGMRAKFAMMNCAASMVTTHVPVPLQPAPLQAVKVESVPAVACRVTTVPGV